jgi:hypothetical protein
MKIILLSVFVFFFVAVPFYILESVVMPGLDSLQQTYAHADDIAEQVAAGGSVPIH